MITLENGQKVEIGGLFRCCIETLSIMEQNHFPVEGDIIKCPICKDELIFTDGAWEWNSTEVRH